MSQPTAAAGAPTDALELRDSRTGNSYSAPIRTEGPEGDTYIRASDIKQVKREAGEFGTLSYDPAFMNTASCRSAITFIDGDKGILRYRGYPIEQLAENATFLEVAYLLRHGNLPDQKQYDTWVHDITFHTYVHENIRKFLEGFRYDAHPMNMLCSATAALSSFYPQARDIHDPQQRYISMIRLMAKLPTIAAFAYRHVKGLPFIYPDNDLSYTENFLSMVARMSEPKYEANPVFVKALEVLFILHADHEQNCSTTAMRVVGSSHADPYSSAAAAAAALYGPRHGGANEAVLRMLNTIGTLDNVDAYVKDVREGKMVLQGFGHRVYKNYDPRAKIIKKIAYDVFEVTGKNELLDIALKLEETALADDYFVSRKLYPNVDFYSGLIYQAMGFPIEMYTVLFAIPRMAGWLAHWSEMLDQNSRIARPRQLYTGSGVRDYVPIAQR
jgi:citrate synthase